MTRMQKNISEAAFVLTERQMHSADAERILIAYDTKDDLVGSPQPVRFAHYISSILDRVSVPIEEHDLIAGRSVIRELTEDEELIYKKLIYDAHYPYNTYVFESGHCSYDWEMIIEHGLSGLIEKARNSMRSKTDDGRRLFLNSLIKIYESIQRYLVRYSEAAESKGMSDLSETLRKAAFEKPSDFRTALQLLWIITLIDCSYVTANPTLTLGRLDKILYPLYKADLDSGKLTREQAADLITDYYCKHNLNMGRGEHQVGDESNTST